MKHLLALLCFLILGPLGSAAHAANQIPDGASLDDLMSPDAIAAELNEIAPLQVNELFSNVLFGRPVVEVQISKSGQFMDVFVRGEQWAHWPVSTGRETWDTPPNGAKYFSGTPSGSWKPTRLVQNHMSALWKVPMPYAIFFTGGIAIHAANSAVEYKLGSRASGGCIRLQSHNARLLFDLVNQVGLKNTRITVY